ncbi:hypothetical protein Tco_0405156 [Tanacetum coccineum]
MDEHKVVVDVKTHGFELERESHRSVEANQTKARGFAKLHIGWRGFLPTLDSILPGGNLSFVYQNIEGLNRSIIGSVVTSRMLNPQLFGVTFDLPSLSRNQPLSTTFDDESQFSPQRHTHWLYGQLFNPTDAGSAICDEILKTCFQPDADEVKENILYRTGKAYKHCHDNNTRMQRIQGQQYDHQLGFEEEEQKIKDPRRLHHLALQN